MEDEEDEGG